MRGHLISIHIPSTWMAYGCVFTMRKGSARWNLRDYDASSPRLRSGPPPLQLLKIVRLNRPFGNVPEPEIQLHEQDSVPSGAVVPVSIDGRHRFSKISRPSIIILTRGHGIEGDAHYGPFVRHGYLARRNPKAPNLQQVHLIPSELFDALRTSGFEVRQGISARTSLRSGSISNAFPSARCSGLAPRRCSNLPASARLASS